MADPLFTIKDELTGDEIKVFASHGPAFAAHIVMRISETMDGRTGSIQLLPEQVANLRAALTQAEAALRVRQASRLRLYCNSCHYGWYPESGGDEACPKCERDSAVRRV